jgi:hypothetical protein
MVSLAVPHTHDDHGCAEDSVADLLLMIRAEYDEMPGLRLTLAQACRLFGIGPHTAETVMQMLVDTGVLARTATGAFMRRRTLN